MVVLKTDRGFDSDRWMTLDGQDSLGSGEEQLSKEVIKPTFLYDLVVWGSYQLGSFEMCCQLK